MTYNNAVPMHTGQAVYTADTCISPHRSKFFVAVAGITELSRALKHADACFLTFLETS